jgi:MoaA/NifB/PqqE/SkfB family radical SAM enzyme
MGVMDDGLFRKIVDDFAGIAERNHFEGRMTFCNMGELFIFPDVIEKIAYVLGKGLKMYIQTNAALLSKALVDRLLATGYRDSILISCHGVTPQVYRKIMGLDASKTLANIDYLIAHYPKDKIGIQAIPYRWPRGEAKRVRRYWKNKGVSVRMPLPNNRAGLLPELGEVHRKSLVGCRTGRPMGEMVICFNGDVVLCCNDMAQEEVVGNLRQSSVTEVWNGSPFLERIEEIYCGKPSSENFICKRCEFGEDSRGLIHRALKNFRHELRKAFLVYIW